MNSLRIAILVYVFINNSYGFLTNCIENANKTCTVQLKPDEPAYKLFLRCLKDSEKQYIGLDFGETNLTKIEKENELIEKNVSKESKEKFFTKLRRGPYASNKNIIVVPYNSTSRRLAKKV
uniref:Transposase n=1 Tax=Strongyloides papillosus TaxID=174720 RepID=A0A0N5BRE7_STREA